MGSTLDLMQTSSSGGFWGGAVGYDFDYPFRIVYKIWTYVYIRM